MKRVWLFALIWLLLSLMGPARGQQSTGGATGSAIAWDMDPLLVEIYTQPQQSPQLNRSLPFVAVQLQSGVSEEWLGILFGSVVDRDRFWVYELYDEGAQQLIKRISLNEMLGITQNRGCKLVLDDQLDRNRIVSEYEIRTGDYHFLFKRFITLLEDANVAGGKRLMINFELENLGKGSPQVRFSIRHPNDDFAIRYGEAALLTINRSRDEATQEFVDWPLLVQVFEPVPQTIELEGPQQGKDAFTVSTITWAAQPVQRRIAKGRVELGRMHIGVTTLDPIFAREQAENLAEYLRTSKPTPKLSVHIEPDKWEVFPGDTISYRLRCVHTGTGKSVGGAVVDPIPSGVRYLPDTASGPGTLIRYSTDGGKTFVPTPPPDQEVTHIRWEIQRSLDPGAALEMSFEVQVK